MCKFVPQVVISECVLRALFFHRSSHVRVSFLTFLVARWCLFYRRPSFLGYELGESVAFVYSDITGQKG